jgi:N-acetylneuraminic acid mutarotase
VIARRRALLCATVIATGCGDDLPAPTCGVKQWAAAPAMPDAVQETAVVAVDRKVYVIGGFNASIAIVDAVHVFDTVAQTWSLGPALPMPLHHANAAVVDGTIYVLGALEGGAFVAIGPVFAWNPTTDAGWTTKTSMPAGLERGAAVVGAIGDTIYVAGGLRNESQATLVAYSTTTDTWSADLPPVPQPFDHGCGGVVGDKLYVLGGRFMGNTPLVFAYSPGGAWEQKAPMPTARSGTACGICDDQIIVAGGELDPNNADSVWPDVEAYNTTTDRWLPLPPMTTPRHGFGGAVVDGTFYVPGGAIKMGFAAVATHEVLRP